MKPSIGIKQRLSRAFILQVVFISVAAVLGVWAAAFLLEEVLVNEALREEATYFWAKQAQEPGFPLPDTRNLTGYLDRDAGARSAPQAWRALDAGFHSIPTETGFTTLYISERNADRLYLVFQGEQVRALAVYFGLVPLTAVLVVLYLSVWLAYRSSHRAISPITLLAKEVNRLDPQAPDPGAFTTQQLCGDADEEVRVLAAALAQFAERLNAFVERERNFTRDASHELRSPLTVIRIAADMLLSEQELSAPAQSSVLRIKRAAQDMEELMEAFLLLARESDQGFTQEEVCVNDIVTEELERARLIAADKPIEVDSTAAGRLWVVGPDKVLASLIGNLLRNSFSYTDSGRVTVRLDPGQLVIEDSGIGISEQQVKQVFQPYFRASPQRRGGHGVGLTIVKRLSDRFGWPVEIASTPGQGTRVMVRFPAARWEAGANPPP